MENMLGNLGKDETKRKKFFGKKFKTSKAKYNDIYD